MKDRAKKITQGLLILLLAACQLSMAQSSDLVRAKHLINQVERGLTRIQTNDVNTINGYTDKLKQAKDILEAETDKQNASFKEVANQWMATREQLYATLENWKSPSPQPSAATGTATSNNGQSSSELYDHLIAKYRSQNRPRLAAEADLKTSQTWLAAMLNLYTGAWQQDNQQAQQWLANGRLSKNDYDRFDRWVNGTWHNQIGEQINQAYGGWNNTLNANVTSAQQLLSIATNDRNKVMNSAGGDHLIYNQTMIAQAQDYLTLVSEIEQAFGKQQINLRKKQSVLLTQASQHLQELTPFATQYLAEWKKAPKKSNKNPNSLYLWLNGNRFAEITNKREIWINSNFVGSFSESGEIYHRGNYVGKLEPNGELWISKQNRSAKMLENGEVWIGGSHVGTIDEDGTVWGTGGASSIEGPGDWRYAAVVFFLQIFPLE